MIHIDIMQLVIKKLKDSQYYDESTSITGITFEENNIGTVWFTARHGEILGRVDFEPYEDPLIRIR